ncbi:MAG: LEPR-XLL domain-containing protein, partial [Pseudomonadaceae bacterium]|nr:LEPR-XLL domain-containing protein [Pseudomonadaceae bacterium]
MFAKPKLLAQLIKNAFKVEALEARILLSGDPVFGAMQVASTRLLEPSSPLDAFTEQYTLASFQKLNQSSSQQASIYEQPAADSSFQLDDTPFDLANIKTDLYLSGSSLLIGEKETLGGSGTVNLNLVNTGKLSPGYSPGLQSFESLVNTNLSEITIELAGLTAGSEYDQLNIANNLVFDGKLSIELLNGYQPKVGDEFTIMTYGSYSGAFDAIEGLTVADSNLYFEIEQSATELKLVTKAIDSGSTFLSEILGTEQQNIYGELLNLNYFNASGGYSFTGDLSFSSLAISGEVSVDYIADFSLYDSANQPTLFDAWQLNIKNGSARFAAEDAFTLNLAGLNLGLNYLTTSDTLDDRSWFYANGTATSAETGLLDSLSLKAHDLNIVYGQAVHNSSDGLLDLSQVSADIGNLITQRPAEKEAFLILSGATEIDLAGQTLKAKMDMALNPLAADAIQVNIDQGTLAITAGAGASGLNLSLNDLKGAFLIDEEGMAGTLNANNLALTQLDGSALPSMALNKVNNINVDFNTAPQQDFFTINANLDLGLSLGAAAYNLSGQFGFTKTSLAIIEGQAAQDVFLLSLTDGETALTVGNATSGTMLRLAGLQGAGLITNLAGQFGTAGSLNVGSVALTKVDGVTPLIADLSMLPLDLPFNFNLFDLDPSLKIAPNLANISLPSLNLKDLANLDLTNLGFSLYGEVDFNLANAFEFNGKVGFSKQDDEIII